MNRAREDAKLIEKGFEYYALYLNANKKILRFENIIDFQKAEIELLNDRLGACSIITSKQEEKTANATKQANELEILYKKERKTKNKVMIASGVGIGLLVYSSLSR
jgi:hypothetical protein